jgi:hypothetical protein
MVNYLSKFSRRLAEFCAPIYSVVGARSAWLWDAPQQQAFENIKRELSSEPVLCVFDMRKRHRVSADASRAALGSVLLQENDGHWQPVEYASRRMTTAEQRYAMVEKEALAATWACEKFDYYLVGREFEIETDHKPLVPILGTKDLSQLPLRVQRFKLRMMRYSYSIFHTPGSRMFVADCLSRPVGDACDDRSIMDCRAVEAFVAGSLADNFDGDVREQEILEATRADETAQRCVGFVERGWPASGKSVPADLMSFYHVRDRLSVYGGLILLDNRMYVPHLCTILC